MHKKCQEDENDQYEKCGGQNYFCASVQPVVEVGGVDLAELSVPSLAASLGLEVGLEVRETFVYPGLVTDTGDPIAIGVAQDGHGGH